MITRRLTNFALLFMTAWMTSCSLFIKEDNSIGGKAGEILVVTEKKIWDSEAGQTLSDSLMKECPYLPQREPMYNLAFVPSGNFTNMFKIHRNLIVLKTDSGVADGSFAIKTNVWAKRQLVFELTGKDIPVLHELLVENMPRIKKALEETERDRVISNTRHYQEHALADSVKAFCSGEMVFPSGYTMKKENENFMWISYETHYVQQGFIIFRTPASHSAGELSGESLIGLMNRVLKLQVPGSTPNSYMIISSHLEPGHRHINYNGREIEEIRGLWEVKNDFMGGPFVAHNFYSPDGKMLVTMIAYVYAPKYDKRLYIRQVESLLYSY